MNQDLELRRIIDLAAKLVKFIAKRVVNLLRSMFGSQVRWPDPYECGRALMDVHSVYDSYWANVGRRHLAHKDF